MDAIFLDTTIKSLLEKEVISTRTYNCLTSAGYNTINDIMLSINSPEELLKLPKFGKKSFFEMSSVFYRVINNPAPTTAEDSTDEVSKLHNSIDRIIETSYQETLEKYKNYSNNISSRFSSGNILHRAIVQDFNIVLRIDSSLDLEHNIELRQAFLYFISNVIAKLDENALSNSTLYPIYKNIETEVRVSINSFSRFEKAHYFMPFDLHKYINDLYNRMCESNLSVRARNFQTQYLPTFEEIIKYFDEPEQKYNSICPGKIMKKTLSEIFIFNQKFKRLYLSIEDKTQDELEDLKIKHIYPFLISTQRAFVRSFMSAYGHVPLFYIINEYFRISDERADKIFSLRYGLFDNHRRTLEEIAKAYGLTRERIRQISASKKIFKKVISSYSSEISAYSGFFSLPFICETSFEYIEIKNKEKLSFDFNTFAAFLDILADDFKIVEIQGQTVAINKKSSLAFLDINKLTSTLDTLSKSRFSQETRIPLTSISNNINDDVKIDFLRRIVVDFFNLTLENDQIVFQQNFVDISEILYNILKENGSPMNVPDLFKELKIAYPEIQYNEPNQIKPFLYKHEHIRSIGKQSLYGLDSWKNLYFGTIRDLMFEIISASDEPVHIGEIYEKVVEYYPETNIKSISSSIQSDTFNRFTIFQDGYVGVKDRDYIQDFQEKHIFQRASFAERMKKFREFVETYHRFPLSNGGEEEASLRRWYYNVENCIVDAPNEELLDEFLNMIENYNKSGIPRTGYESQFYDLCEKYKSYINTHYTLPTLKNGSELYWWLKRSRENFDSYIDHRREYLINLLQYISSLGFEV